MANKRKRSSTSTTTTTTPRRNAKRKTQARPTSNPNGDDVGGSHSESGGAVAEFDIDSDALDDPNHKDDKWKDRQNKQKKAVSTSLPTPKRVNRKSKINDESSDVDLDEGQEVLGRIVKAPTTGLVPPGQISQNTLDFLTKLKDPNCNDRQWFKLHEPVYRQAEKEWKDFIEAFTDVLIEIDPEIPPLPPKDVVHRIYRDIRFSNDKTPYKKGFSASFSRSGRKGIFAGYHIVVKPGNESMIAAGSWCPSKNELDTIRANIKRDSSRLRQIISSQQFEEFFGQAEPHPDGERRNIFGMEDELKTAPKGVAKDDKDIDLLRCRSFAVAYRFRDSEVLDPGFRYRIGDLVRVVQPFVHCLNDMMTVSADSDGDDSDDDS